MEKSHKHEFPNITMWTEEELPGILFGIYRSRLVIDLKVAQELVANRLEFCGDECVYTLIDFTNVKSVTKEARDYMNHPDGGLKGILGGAFVSNNVVATLFINLYIKVSSPVVPARFFTDKREALNWLRSIQKERRNVVQMNVVL